MTAEEIIEQLERLIDDREAFIRAYAPDRNVFVRDKEALEEAVKVLKRYNLPVRHGRWIPEDEYYVDDTYICSVCGYEFIITDGDLESNELNYCPGCGAKMDDKDINVPTKSGMEVLQDDGIFEGR